MPWPENGILDAISDYTNNRITVEMAMCPTTTDLQSISCLGSSFAPISCNICRYRVERG